MCSLVLWGIESQQIIFCDDIKTNKDDDTLMISYMFSKGKWMDKTIQSKGHISHADKHHGVSV